MTTKEWKVFLAKIRYDYTFPKEIVEIRNEDGLLHSQNEPAWQSPTRLVWYKNGKRHGLDISIFGSHNYYYEGILVPREYIESPELLDWKQVINETNQEVKYVGIKLLGVDEIEKHAKVIDKTRDKALFQFDLGFQEKTNFLKVLNSTPDIAGTRKTYLLCVPPTVKTCQEAVAWTFGMEANQYRPIKET